MRYRIRMALAGCVALAAAAPAQDVKRATYIGGKGADVLTAAAALPDGKIAVGGIVGASPSGKRGRLPTGGGGRVMVLDADGKVAAERTLSGPVSDLDADAEGSVYVCGAFGSAKLGPALRKTIWASDTGGAGSRIAPGPGGGAVVMSGKKITVLDGRGQARRSVSVRCSFLNDVTYHAGTKRVIAAGFDNKRGRPPGQRNYPVQVAFVYAYGPDGRRVWRAYGWGGQEVADLHLMADTRAYRVAVGADGKVYVAGESAGGNSMWTRAAQDLKDPSGFVKGDRFQHAYNTGANHITAVARLDARTGKSEAATLVLSRTARGRGANYRPRAITADTKGNVYVGGFTDAAGPKTPGSFGTGGAGAYFLILDAQLRRRYATTLGEGGTTWGAAAGSGCIVAVGACRGADALPTVKPIKSAGDAAGDGFLVVLPPLRR